MSNFRSLLGCALGLALVATEARAEIITPISATPSSEFAAAANLIDGSGLDGIGPVPGQLHNNNENHMWQTFSGDPTADYVEFTLDQNYDISKAYIWQYNGPDGNGTIRPDREINDFEISVSADLAAPFVSVGNFKLAASHNQAGAPPAGQSSQAFVLGGANSVRRVRIDIDSLHIVPLDPLVVSGDLGGLSEVRFLGVPSIPEPTTLALAAFSVLSLTLGRNRRKNLAG